MLDVKMTQWGVGHGGFHTTEIHQLVGNEATTRHYIYDCGSTAKVRSLYPRIESYVERLKDRGAQHIDTLYLSHFDYDHVNGLKKLSKELAHHIQIVKIVVPFLTPEQQLATIAYPNYDYSPLYENLVLNPQVVLRQLFPGAEVEFLAASEVNELSEEGGLSFNSPGSMVIGSNSAGSDRVDILWEVIAYVQPDVRAKAREFWKELQKNRLHSGKNLDTDTITDLVDNHRAELRELANKILGPDGSNSSSIVLYSAPAWGQNVSCFIRKNDHRISWDRLPSNATGWPNRNSEKFGGWLSTGDARLETRSAVTGLWRGLGAQRAQRVMVIAAPHHGSKNNSSAYLWQSFPNASFVTAHTRRNSSHHPSQAVRDEIEHHQGKLYKVEERSSDITLSCTVYPPSP